MEVLVKIWHEQRDFEDALKMEINYEDIKENKDGKKLYNYLKKRRRIVNVCGKILDKF
jgi:hypothetical protein